MYHHWREDKPARKGNFPPLLCPLFCDGALFQNPGIFRLFFHFTETSLMVMA